MTMTLSGYILTTTKQMLEALAGQLKKAEAYGEEKGETDLLDRRLADDMQPLSTQIGFTCLQVEQLLARLTGGPSPDLSPVATFGEAHALIARTIAMIDAADANQIDGMASQLIAMSLPNGMNFSLSGADYARDWSIPQFYFHLMAAYALIRQSGVPIGKADYVPHMARHFVRT